MQAPTIEALLANKDRLPPQVRARLAELLIERDRLAQITAARTSFMPYVNYVWPSFIAGAHHAKMAAAFERVARGECKRLIINMGPRHALTTDTPIPTTAGMKTMASISPGDYVFGPDGVPTQVLGKSEVFQNRQLYRVWTDDGAHIDTDGEHLWTVRLDRKRPKHQTYTTEQLWQRQNGAFLRTKRGGEVEIRPDATDPAKTRLPRLPDTAPAQHPLVDLPIDPYVLGVWLGDGTSLQAIITTHDADAAHIRPEFERRGFTTTDQATRMSFGVLGLKVKLRELGVLGNKHIPSMYLTASVQQRRDLLKGLMDTDGNVSKTGQCFFAQSDKRLCQQVQQLIRSLGIKANLLESRATLGGVDHGPTWKASFYASDMFLLPRKEARTLKNERTFGRYIRVEKLSTTGDTQCIRVDRDDGLFLAGEGYICTHNTKSEFASYLLPSWFLGLFPEKKVIQASNTGELAVGFGRKVRNLVDSDPYKDIFPDTELRADSKAAGRWATSKGGDYFAIGVGGTVTGKGADLLIIDDPHALPLDTLVPTPRGFKTIAQLCVGDAVFGPDGLPTRVVAKSPVARDRQVYELTTSDGITVPCDAGHLWPYMSDTNIARAKVRNAPARDLAQWTKANRPCLPRHAPVQYPDQTLPIDPYLLGVWLGDGTASLGRITTSAPDYPHIRAAFDAAGYDTTACTGDKAAVHTFGVRGLRRQLIDNNLLNNKHIPEIYLTGAEHQRMALVQGLMDADGDVSAAGQCSFNSTSHTLARQFQELVHSLGVKAGLKSYPPTRANHAATYRVNFKLYGCARLARKLERTHTPTDKRQRSYAVVPTTRRADVQCITVDREDGLFLVGRGYVVTHNSEQEAALAESDPTIYDKTYEWYTSGPRQRLQPGGAIIIVMTRWSRKDLTGEVLKASAQRGGEEWDVIEFPAILPSGNPLWPEFWPLAELEALRLELPNHKWMAQYQQNPTSETAAIVKREWWQMWEEDTPPHCEFTLMSWDTAFEKHNRADYSACTLWGVFYRADATGIPQANIILLNAFRKRMEFPELKKSAMEQYDTWAPDSTIVEKKASGAPLIYELRAMGIPVQEFTPSRGNDKIARLNAVSDLFASGRVWAPRTHWAEEVINEVASFPGGDNDDYVDSTSMALARFRQGGFIRTLLDEDDNDDALRTRALMNAQPYY